MCEPRRVHWVAAKHILRYLQGTMEYGLDYRQGDGVSLASYTDFDWAVVLLIGRALQGAVLGWVRQLCHGSAESSSQ